MRVRDHPERPAGGLGPHGGEHRARRLTFREQQEHARTQPPFDVEQWYADRDADDKIFGDDRLDH